MLTKLILLFSLVFCNKVFIIFIVTILISNNAMADLKDLQKKLDLLQHEIWQYSWLLFPLGVAIDRLTIQILRGRIIISAIVFAFAMFIARYTLLEV